uniref:Cobalamin biosynthesis precorrin-8X methylmutase CobH/CbiC domain-containing protein n=1 Tax=Streptomyces avermitilis TaxID=33903 RepID=A0A499W1Z6_STRAX|nr:hypothetical protein SAVMC3_72780 [Streptomyces avermitilis]
MNRAFVPEDRVVHPIEQESFRRLRARLDTSHFPPLTRAVVERVIHSAADLDYAEDLVMDEGTLERAHAALHAGRRWWWTWRWSRPASPGAGRSAVSRTPGPVRG